MTDSSPLAVLADIHGNTPALEAVIAHARAAGAAGFVNLGDTFYGPLDAAGTWDILKQMEMPTILGNQDRVLLEGGPRWADNPDFKRTIAGIGRDGLAWLKALPATLKLDDILLCHGTPRCDTAYLLEDIATGLPAPRACEAVLEDILPEAEGCSLILAGHSHHPGLIACDEYTLVNPGSVGLPAYDDDTPPHVMASGSPHAKYALVSPTGKGWEVDFINVQYDWEKAAGMARANGREDWANWLATGMA